MMRAKVIKVFFDHSGLHKPGEVVEVENIEKMSTLVMPLEVKAEDTTTEEKKPKKKKKG